MTCFSRKQCAVCIVCYSMLSAYDLTFSASALYLSLCPLHVYSLYTAYGAKRQKLCCSSWLQYRICHSLSTIQYVLVPQVQRQLQAALRRAAGSRPASSSRSLFGSGSEPRTPLQLGRRGRNRQEEGSPQDQLRNSQCQDSREARTCQGEAGLYSPYKENYWCRSKIRSPIPADN